MPCRACSKSSLWFSASFFKRLNSFSDCPFFTACCICPCLNFEKCCLRFGSPWVASQSKRLDIASSRIVLPLPFRPVIIKCLRCPVGSDTGISISFRFRNFLTRNRVKRPHEIVIDRWWVTNIALYLSGYNLYPCHMNTWSQHRELIKPIGIYLRFSDECLGITKYEELSCRFLQNKYG